MAGFVYIMSNPSLGDRIKIGKSDRDPEEHRKRELQSTGVPEPFIVEYSAFVEDHHSLERKLHQKFSSARVSDNREFFTCSIPEAILAIRDMAGSTLKHEEVNYQSPEDLERFEAERQEKNRINEIKDDFSRRLKGARYQLQIEINEKLKMPLPWSLMHPEATQYYSLFLFLPLLAGFVTIVAGIGWIGFFAILSLADLLLLISIWKKKVKRTTRWQEHKAELSKPSQVLIHLEESWVKARAGGSKEIEDFVTKNDRELIRIWGIINDSKSKKELIFYWTSDAARKLFR